METDFSKTLPAENSEERLKTSTWLIDQLLTNLF